MADRGNTRKWRELRARVIRAEVRKHGAVYCSKCSVGPLDPNAKPGSRWAIDADHVNPVALGGAEVPKREDVRLMCVRCNRGEGRKIQVELARREGRLSSQRSGDGAQPTMRLADWQRPDAIRRDLKGTWAVDDDGRRIEAPWSPSGWHDPLGRWNPVATPAASA